MPILLNIWMERLDKICVVGKISLLQISFQTSAQVLKPTYVHNIYQKVALLEFQAKIFLR